MRLLQKKFIFVIFFSLCLFIFLLFCNNYFEKINTSKIHTIGDSHSNNGWNSSIIRHWIGPKLCYSFGRDRLKLINLNNLNINDGDIVIFCLGEIDCRSNIHKYVKKNNSDYKKNIENIIVNYEEAIKETINNFKFKLKKVCIYNVVPPVKKNDTDENNDYPYLGSDEERNSYVLYFNNLINKICNKNNWIFFNTYKNYSDIDGFLNKKLSDGNVHIKNSVHNDAFINKYLL